MKKVICVVCAVAVLCGGCYQSLQTRKAIGHVNVRCGNQVSIITEDGNFWLLEDVDDIYGDVELTFDTKGTLNDKTDDEVIDWKMI